MSWLLSEIAEAVEGKIVNEPKEDIKVESIHYDSREIESGAIFVPIVAERDGHDFVEDAFKKGAVASFWGEALDNAPADFPLIVVENTLEAFQQFAGWYRRKINPRVVGITGSNGKTTTKDMTAAILSQKYKTHKTEANFNNDIGVPLTLLTMPEDTEVAVVEMGMNAPNEIQVLSRLAEPDVAVVTMIGESHIEAFDSRGDLADEKMSILVGLKQNGLFIHPEAETLIDERIPEGLREKSFGNSADADLYAENIIEERETTTFTLVSTEKNKQTEFTLPVPGKYNVKNALMAILVGLEFAVSIEQIKAGLESFALTKNRLEWLTTEEDVHLLNDAYNASPTSMKAVLDYFSNVQTEGEKIAVLGDILELGERSKEYHESIAEAIDLDKFKAVYLYGDEMRALYDKLKDEESVSNVEYFTGDKEPLIQKIKDNTQAEDCVLFKSSNGTDLLSVIKVLKKEKD
jgi:UDP-N-acetylmuramoyl-tripeptide--D-alanyl-D-alanine ligase